MIGNCGYGVAFVYYHGDLLQSQSDNEKLHYNKINGFKMVKTIPLSNFSDISKFMQW